MYLGAPTIESGILNNLQGPVPNIRGPIEKVVHTHVVYKWYSMPFSVKFYNSVFFLAWHYNDFSVHKHRHWLT